MANVAGDQGGGTGVGWAKAGRMGASSTRQSPWWKIAQGAAGALSRLNPVRPPLMPPMPTKPRLRK